MSDTPETDAAIKASDGQWSFVLKETCQRLERERDEARNCFKVAMETAETYKRERDDLQDQRDLSIRMAKQRERERDEAREALRNMLSGWKYIRSVHGDLYGVGWDRAQSKAETALDGTK